MLQCQDHPKDSQVNHVEGSLHFFLLRFSHRFPQTMTPLESPSTRTCGSWIVGIWHWRRGRYGFRFRPLDVALGSKILPSCKRLKKWKQHEGLSKDPKLLRSNPMDINTIPMMTLDAGWTSWCRGWSCGFLWFGSHGMVKLDLAQWSSWRPQILRQNVIFLWIFCEAGLQSLTCTTI